MMKQLGDIRGFKGSPRNPVAQSQELPSPSHASHVSHVGCCTQRVDNEGLAESKNLVKEGPAGGPFGRTIEMSGVSRSLGFLRSPAVVY